jgi:hypothetical protein
MLQEKLILVDDLLSKGGYFRLGYNLQKRPELVEVVFC